ncbi:MAG TPA: HAD family phosphatase [Miltoncostaeaceae bacterium]|nr:HAD family phosphatase [Miltoncostaeaceae bacterium]
MKTTVHPPLAAVVFDMDGVLIATEALWDRVREELARERGGRWSSADHRAMMGMNTAEWTDYMHAELGVDLTPGRIRDEVVARLADAYRARLPLLPGAVDAVRALARRWPLGLASSSPQELIELTLELAGVRRCFAVALSSEAVERGKPAPDVYLEVLRRLSVDPWRAAAIEDSASGLRAAHAAGMRVVAVPNPDYPPAREALALADLVLPDMRSLTPDALADLTD